MIREFVVAREFLDEVGVQVERMLGRHHRARAGAPDDLRALAELDLEIARADELIRARCAASHALGIELPLDRLHRAFALSPTEARVVEILVALELVARVREAVPRQGWDGDRRADRGAGLPHQPGAERHRRGAVRRRPPVPVPDRVVGRR